MNRVTHTVVRMDVPEQFYQFVREKLSGAGYEQLIHTDATGREFIDMTGIALAVKPEESRPVENLGGKKTEDELRKLFGLANGRHQETGK